MKRQRPDHLLKYAKPASGLCKDQLRHFIGRQALALLVSIPALITVSHAAAQNGQPAQSVKVAAASCPPFVMVESGRFSGLAIYLWDEVAREMNVSSEYAEYPLGDLLQAIGKGRGERVAEIGVSCISVTAEREKIIDFSHSFNETHTAIAVRQGNLGSTVVAFFSSGRVLRAILVVLGASAVVGLTFYFLEHKINPKLYSRQTRIGKTLDALIIGVLFVTRGPIRFYEFKTQAARVLSAILAISSTFLIAGITAVLASAFTINSLQSQVRDLQDLRKLKVGALDASTSSAFLSSKGIAHQTRKDLDTLIEELDAGHLEAVVSDAAFLQYRIKLGKEQGQFKYLTVLPYEFESQNYAFVLDMDSPYREAINRALLEVRKRPEWRAKVAQYLGE